MNMRRVVSAARMEEIRNSYDILVGKPEGKRPLGRHRHRWECNTKTGVKERVFEDADWINVTQRRC
jgi:hypothetical protein